MQNHVLGKNYTTDNGIPKHVSSLGRDIEELSEARRRQRMQ